MGVKIKKTLMAACMSLAHAMGTPVPPACPPPIHQADRDCWCADVYVSMYGPSLIQEKYIHSLVMAQTDSQIGLYVHRPALRPCPNKPRTGQQAVGVACGRSCVCVCA